jgi:hypothetical protein
VGTGSVSKGWLDPGELPAQIERNRREASVMGSAFYNMTSVSDNPLGVMTKLKNEQFKYPALVPHMPWISTAVQTPGAPGATPYPFAAAPSPPTVRLVASANSVRLTITDASPAETAGTGSEVRYFIIYRVDNSANLSRTSAIKDPANILEIVVKGGKPVVIYTDRAANKSDNYFYYITSVNRLHVESRSVKIAIK